MENNYIGDNMIQAHYEVTGDTVLIVIPRIAMEQVAQWEGGRPVPNANNIRIAKTSDTVRVMDYEAEWHTVWPKSPDEIKTAARDNDFDLKVGI